MTDYQKLYIGVFNAVTSAIEQLQKQNYGAAKETLIQAQLRAEEFYLEQ